MIKELKIIYNKTFPFGEDNDTMAIWPFVFTKFEEGKLKSWILNHERIHLRQQIETLFVVFLLWYAIEFLIKYAITRDYDKVMKIISFEREAYVNQRSEEYLQENHWFGWLKYITYIK